MRICIFCLALFFGCSEKNKDVKKEYFSTGELRSIKRHKNKKLNGEVFYFYPSGVVERTIQYKNNIGEGYSYYFYPSGCLKSIRYYKNHKEAVYGLEYYDQPFSTVKMIQCFNDSGNVVYVQYFDDHGRFVGEEGTKPLLNRKIFE